MINNMLNYYNMVKNENINIIYNGPIWAAGVEGIATTLKRRFELEQLSLPTSQAIFSVFVEQMNNMLMYSAEKVKDFTSTENKQTYSSGIFILSSTQKQYCLQTGNVIKNQHITLIQERIDYLNTLDKTELRKYYKERIKADDDNLESKGAGIGLIEIAKRSSEKIKYAFEPYDDDRSFFTMHVTIG